LNDTGYDGGFSEADVEELLELMSRNHLGWQNPLATRVAGRPESEGRLELEQGFCRTRPDVAAQFAPVTLRGDNRADPPLGSTPALIIASAEDSIAPMTAATYVRDAIPEAEFEVVSTRGHCPHPTPPADTAAAIHRFLRSSTPATTPGPRGFHGLD
jgi:sigma-B regulation protein RsbQ